MYLDDLTRAYVGASQRLLLLDYDGTLTPLVATPAQAKPSATLRNILKRLTADPKNDVVIISGRDYQTLDTWLGDLPLSFVAEHGFVYRRKKGSWQLPSATNNTWMQTVLPFLEECAKANPGSLIEKKVVSLVWHYREAADQPQAKAALQSLHAQLEPIASDANLRVLTGKKFIEVQPAGTDKGTGVTRWLRQQPEFVMAAGDDTTDEDLFRVMPQSAYTIKIGPERTLAKQRLDSVEIFVDLLSTLAYK